jgi:hypothetical protein
MADLASILKDPDYTGANEATKRAIFDKFSAKDPDYTNANDATKAAIQKKFGVAPKSLITIAGDGSQVEFQSERAFNDFKTMPSRNVEDAKMLGATVLPSMTRDEKIKAIPMEPPRPGILSATEREVAAQPKPAPAPSGIPGPRAGFLTGLGRGAASLADQTLGAVGPMVAEQIQYPIARALGSSPAQASAAARSTADQFSQPFGRAFGVTNTPEYKGEVSGQVMQFIGENVGKGAKWISEKTGLPEQDVANMIGTLMLAGPKVLPSRATIKALPEATARAIAPEIGPVPGLERQVRKAEAASAADFKNSGRIEAAHAGNKLGFVTPPVQSNPTLGNRARAALQGENSREANVAATQKNLERLDVVARKDMGIPGNVSLTSDAPFKTARAQHSGPYDQIAGMGTLTADRGFIADLASHEVSPGLSPEFQRYNAQIQAFQGLAESGQLTGESALRDIRKLREQSTGAWKAGDTVKAEFARGMADAMENLVERNMKNPKDIQKFKDARREMAKIYAYEGAVDFNIGKFDPLKIAEVTKSEPGKYTGVLRDIGQYAGNFPYAISSFEGPTVGTRLTRSGVGGVLGAAAGTLVGNPFLGGAAGSVAGSAVGAVGRRKIMSESGRKRALPADRRIGPDKPYIPPPGEFSPYDPNILMRDAGPNWRPGFEKTYPDFPPEPQFSPLPQLPNEVPQSRARRYEADKRAAEAAEAAAAAAEGQRAPTKGGVEFSLDPFTNKLRPVKQVGEALPPTNELASAVNKMQSGQSFAMSATEKIAWKKAQVDLKLATDATYASKFTPEDLSNRQWLMDTVKKTRQKADAFDEIAKRADETQAGRDAAHAAEVSRDRMLDFAEDLQTRLSALPKRKLGQGPKTRNALRDGRSNNN